MWALAVMEIWKKTSTVVLLHIRAGHSAVGSVCVSGYTVSWYSCLREAWRTKVDRRRKRVPSAATRAVDVDGSHCPSLQLMLWKPL